MAGWFYKAVSRVTLPIAATISTDPAATISTDPFEIMRDNAGIADDATVQGAGASAYRLLMVVGVIGILSSIMICGVSLALRKNGQARQEVKHTLMVKLGIAVVLFGFVGLLGLVLQVISQF